MRKGAIAWTKATSVPPAPRILRERSPTEEPLLDVSIGETQEREHQRQRTSAFESVSNGNDAKAPAFLHLVDRETRVSPD